VIFSSFAGSGDLHSWYKKKKKGSSSLVPHLAAPLQGQCMTTTH